jgi:hypothetical protein
LSPFDMLRPLPGFRSVGVTGRFWGFLALPLSLLAAAALWRFVTEHEHTKKLKIFLSCALALQFGFQTETILGQWLGSNAYHAVAIGSQFRGGPEKIEYVTTDESHLQGEFVTPTRAVLNCYDMDDFIRADMKPGNQIVKQIAAERHIDTAEFAADGKFVSWNHLQLDVKAAGEMTEVSSNAPVRLVLNQAFNSSWHASGCDTERGENGNLVLKCPIERLRSGSVDLLFHNEISARAASVSVNAWSLWLTLLGGALLGSIAIYAELYFRRRSVRVSR